MSHRTIAGDLKDAYTAITSAEEPGSISEALQVVMPGSSES